VRKYRGITVIDEYIQKYLKNIDDHLLSQTRSYDWDKEKQHSIREQASIGSIVKRDDSLIALLNLFVL
jgi:hypothetical protein